MVNNSNPVTQWTILILVSVVVGTCLLIAVAFFRRWQQTRYARYVHNLQRKYRPILAKLLSGTRNPSAISALRALPLGTLELLLDPLFSKRKLPESSRGFLQAFCAELGLTDLWESRLANPHGTAPKTPGKGAHQDLSDRAVLTHWLRAKSIRNLGILRHQQSWPLLVNALDDRHTDIQLVALRSLAALSVPECFPALRDRLHDVLQGKTMSPPPRALKAAMANFDLTCAQLLLPSLRQPDRQIRLHATEILRTLVCREHARQPQLTLTPEVLSKELVELLLSGLSVDSDAEIRARAAEVLVFVADTRVTPVLRALLLDQQWFVRLRTVRAVAHWRQVAAPLHRDIRARLSDLHWRVREAAIQTLMTLGPEGRRQICEHFMTSSDLAAHEQIMEVMERRRLMPDFVKECCAGSIATDAFAVQQPAGDAAPPVPPRVLQALRPEIRQKFLGRFPVHPHSKMLRSEKAKPGENSANYLSSSNPVAA